MMQVIPGFTGGKNWGTEILNGLIQISEQIKDKTESNPALVLWLLFLHLNQDGVRYLEEWMSRHLNWSFAVEDVGIVVKM